MKEKKQLNCREILAWLKKQANPENVCGMARFGICSENTLGVNIPVLRRLARETGKNHDLAGELWRSGIHEARILAAFVDDPKQVTEEQMEEWVLCFDSWDVCDQVCSNLFDRCAFGWKKAMEWPGREEEFVRRAGFALMACLAVHDKAAGDDKFLKLLPLIKKYAFDERNFVKKAVNWALRQIGKRNASLRQEAIGVADKILTQKSKAARWIARDALRELSRSDLFLHQR